MAADATVRELSPWPHHWAWILCALTFPLVWVGGLITTTDAGMAVPDWPGTYGDNMFAFPWRAWILGPWDLFIEHGHRLLASLVGLVTIILLAIVVWKEQRRWLVPVCVAALLLVIFQGVLGGLRVIANERLLAMAHGCTGPAFFAFTCAIVVLTGRTASKHPVAGASFARFTTFTAGLAYLQLVLGASLRHVDAQVGPWAFATLVKFHLIMAAVVAVHTLIVAWRAGRKGRWLGPILGLIVLAQISLGFGTWLVKYGAPGWASGWLPATMGPNIADGWSQKHTVTAHQATGSLLLGLLVALATIAWKAHTRNDEPVLEAPAS